MAGSATVEILTSGDDDRMNALAQDENCDREALFVLSQSLSAEIRTSVARNAATPRIADELLAMDQAVAVRTALAQKAARRAADNPVNIPEKLRTAALQILTRLIADQEVRVRQVIAEEVKASAHLPRDLAVTLARDDSDDVSGPVLEYSPLLTDEDLIDIITGFLSSPKLEAVARRRTVSDAVADQIVETMDTGAIATLLDNPEASITDASMDSIIETARSVETLQPPLVARPQLSAGAIRKICSFVANNLLQFLADRPDLDDETREVISAKVAERLDAENATISDEDAVVSEIRDELMVRMKMGKLNADYLTDAARNGKHTVVSVALSLMTEVEHRAVRRIIYSRNPNMIAALCWKAELPMAFAGLVQELIGKMHPDDCLEPTEDGGYPMSEGTLEWNFALCNDTEAEDEALTGT